VRPRVGPAVGGKAASDNPDNVVTEKQDPVPAFMRTDDAGEQSRRTTAQPVGAANAAAPYVGDWMDPRAAQAS